MNAPLYFDIETEGLPESEIAHLMPEFTAPSNYKDAEKIAANIVEQKTKWLSECALRAETCRVLCVGFMWPDRWFSVIEKDERDIIRKSLLLIADTLRNRGNVIGFNILQFDLPVLLRRAHILRIPVSPILRQRYRGRSYWHEDIYDLCAEWDMGTHKTISLDTLAQSLGVGAKSGNGADFAQLWKNDREKAIEYLRNDCQLLKDCAEVLLR